MTGNYYEYYMWCWIGVIALVGLIFLVQVYFSYYKINEILKCLGETKVVVSRREILGAGFLSRTFFILTIAGMFVFSEVHIREGGFTRAEFEQVPSRLKFQLEVLVYSLFFLVGFCIVLWLVGKYCGWLK